MVAGAEAMQSFQGVTQMNFDDQEIHYSIYLVLDFVDMRLSMDGLSASVQSQLQANPCEGHIFCV